MYYIKRSRLFVYVFFINCFSIIHSINENNGADLLQLNSVLNSLINWVDVNRVGVLGEFLVGKTFKDIVSEEQLKSIDPHIKANDLILLGYNQSQSIYQIKTLQQYGTTCGAHAVKNALWMIHALHGTLNTFTESYVKILDPAIFDKYYQSLTCKKHAFLELFEQKSEIKQGKISCILNNACVPRNSSIYINQIFNFVYAPIPNPSMIMQLGNFWSMNFDLLLKQVQKIEPEAKLEVNDRARDAAILFSPAFTQEDILPFYNLIVKDDFCLAIDAGII